MDPHRPVRLFEGLRDIALKEHDKPVTLSSGAVSKYFFDVEELFKDKYELRNAAQVILQILKDHYRHFDVVGGPVNGACAITDEISRIKGYEKFRYEKNGELNFIEKESTGALRYGHPLIIEDVVTTANTVISCIKALDKVYCKHCPFTVLSIVDRGGNNFIHEKRDRIYYIPLFKYYDFGIPKVNLP